MSNDASGPAPGWYDDPKHPGLHRWWDGHRWTQDTRPATTAPSAPPPDAATRVERPTSRRPTRTVAWVGAAVAVVIAAVVGVVWALGGDDEPAPLVATDADDDITPPTSPPSLRDLLSTPSPADPEPTASQTPTPTPTPDEVPSLLGGDELPEDAKARLEELRQGGSITVGIANEVPFGYVDDAGNVTGEGPEVVRRVMTEFGIDRVEAEVVSFGSLISGLQAGQFDVVAAGMFVTPERADEVLFSDPTFCIGLALAVPAGNPLGLQDLGSIRADPDVTVAVLEGTLDVGYAEAAGVAPHQIAPQPDVDGLYRSLREGTVDAVLGSALTVRSRAADADDIEATPGFPAVDMRGDVVQDCGAVAFRHGDQPLRDAFNATLNRLQDEGALRPLVTQFGFAPEGVRRAESLTAEDLVTP